jgi:hypothetical protein
MVRWPIEEKERLFLKASSATMTGWAELDRARQGGRKERFAPHTLTAFAVNANLTDLETMETDRDQAKSQHQLSNANEDSGRQYYSLNGTTSFPIAVSVRHPLF